MALTPEQSDRYKRHLLLPEIGSEGQEKLLASKVLVVGTGGLGSPIILYLAAAGIGHLTIVDADTVDRSNLQRQVIHDEDWLGKPKVESAKSKIQRLNPDVEVEVLDFRLEPDRALDLIAAHDVVIDATDNYATRYLTNDAAFLTGTPNVYGSIYRYDGQATVFHPSQAGPCYRCLYPEPPPSGLLLDVSQAGVFGVLPGVVGVVQATECIKLLTGIGETLIGRLMQYDSLNLRFMDLKIHPDPECPLCGAQATIKSVHDFDYAGFCG